MTNTLNIKSAADIVAGDIIRHEGLTYSVIDNKASSIIDARSGLNCRYIVISDEAGLLLNPYTGVEVTA